MKTKCMISAAGASVAISTIAGASVPQYTSTIIQPPAGHTYVVPQRLNDAGQVAGISGNSDIFDEYTPFLWPGDGGSSRIVGNGTWIYGLNNSAMVLTSEGLWAAGGAPIPLGGVGVTPGGRGGALDDSGRVFVSNGGEAIIWSPDGGIAVVPADNPFYLVAANNNLQAIGERVLITPSGITPLTTPTFAYSDQDFRTYDISDTGIIVGEADGIDGPHGAVWLPDGSVIDLGVGNMPGAINDLGEVVGFTFDHRYFLWSQSDGFTLIDSTNGVPTLGEPVDYNDRGEILFSAGIYGPSYVLTPIPAPGAPIALATAAILIACRRRR